MSKFSWISTLWCREWDYWSKRIFTQMRVEMILVAVFFVLFGMNRQFAALSYAKMMAVPGEVKAFWGVSDGFTNSPSIFFFVWLLLPLNAWNLWEACNKMVKSLWREEDSRYIYTMCNQWYGRYQICVAKISWNVLCYMLENSILYMIYIVLIALLGYGDSLDTVLFSLIGTYGLSFFIGTAYIVFFSMLAAVIERRNYMIWIDIVVYGFLVLGNLYKVKDLMLLLARQQGMPLLNLAYAMNWTEGLAKISLLQYLNPYRRISFTTLLICIIVCSVLIGIFGVASLYCYKRRRFSC